MIPKRIWGRIASVRHRRIELSRGGADNEPAPDFPLHASSPVALPEGLFPTRLTLADLKPGECGHICRLAGTMQARLRLLEMGLTPGMHVKVVRAAAFGGPLDIAVRGYQLSLRREEAKAVWLCDDEEPEIPLDR